MGGISADFRWCHATFDFVYGSINKAVVVMQTLILSLFIVVNVLWFSYYLSMGSCSTNKDIIFWLSSFTCQHWNWEKSANGKESIIWRKKISLIFRFNQVKFPTHIKLFRRWHYLLFRWSSLLMYPLHPLLPLEDL